MLILETHFTDRRYLRFPKYKIYHTRHPDDKSYGGTAITIDIEDKFVPVTILSIYCPSKQKNKKQHYENVFNTLCNKWRRLQRQTSNLGIKIDNYKR